MNDATLAVERVRELLSYDPATGEFTWRLAFCRKIKAGAVAGTLDHSGYIDIRIDGKKYRAHRLAIVLMAGRWPTKFVDHVNCVKSDNRYANLRECSSAQNNQNVIRKLGASGVKGVKFTRNGTYEVRIRADGKSHYLGTYAALADAGAAYREGAVRYHGEFARLG